MPDTDTIVHFLREYEHQIDEEIGSRVIRDSHDYSSSSYSAYDDGYNTGVGNGTELFKEKLIASIRECTGCERMMFHENDDYICIFCRDAA